MLRIIVSLIRPALFRAAKSIDSTAILFATIALVTFVPLCIFCVPALAQSVAPGAGPQPLITQPINESQLTTLKGNTHPLARPQFDLGRAPASLPMERMLLVLKRSPAQETALRTLLDNQQDKHSPSYHKWLTPEQFGKQFGPADSDMQIISAWLQSHGFQVETTKGRAVLEFSGSASQVQEAFHTTIHKYIVNGEQHWANSTDPQIPTALVPAVKGVLTLHNFVSKPQIHYDPNPVAVKFTHGKKPYVTFPAQNGQPITYALGPQDYSTIYNINPVYNAGVNGNGITIGVIGRSDLYGQGYPSDVSDFINAFGVPYNTPQIILSGPDPGFNSDDAFEATLDVTWSGSVGQAAYVDFVIAGSTNTTDGIDLSEAYIVENNLADIMTESFGSCEYENTDARIAGVNAMAEQAAAQGITFFVSSGDAGAEGCDDPNFETVATGPISVNMLASTPFNVAVGGSIFNENGQDSVYWSDANPLAETALSYIPEDVWNESCDTTSSCASIWAGGGGASAGNITDTSIGGTTPGIPKPSWQSGVNGTQTDSVRDLPDVVLTAASHDPYLLCFEGSCEQGEIYFVWGTSAASPSFAGILALVESNIAQTLQPGQSWRQGQANYVLYPLAVAQQTAGTECNASTTPLPNSACTFNDVTVGNNSVPGEAGYPTGLYSAAVGYDLASGLGSVNVANLVNNWNSVNFNPTTTALTLNGSTNSLTITHGQSVSVAATVTPNSGTATPTGDVVLVTTSLVPSPLDLFRLSGGQASGTTSNLPGSNSQPYSLWAQYGGDGTYAPSSSNSITLTVSAEPSTTTLSLFGNSLSTGNLLASPYPFGTLVNVRADVAGKSGQGIPTGTVTFTDTFGPLPTTNAQVNPPVAVVNNPSLNSQGNTAIGDSIISFDAGNHTISAAYSGDGSFNPSSSTQSVSFTIQPGFAFVSLPSYVDITSPGSSGTASAGIIASTNFTTAVSFTCSGLPTGASCNQASLTGQGPNQVATVGIIVTTTAATSTTQRANLMAISIGALPLACVILLAAPRRRRGIALLGLMVALVVFVPSCGGGGGGGSTPPPSNSGTPTGNYTVTVTATAGTLTQTGTFTLVVE